MIPRMPDNFRESLLQNLPKRKGTLRSPAFGKAIQFCSYSPI